MNTQVTAFLLRHWWWLLLLSALMSIAAGLLGAMSLLIFAAIFPNLNLAWVIEKEGLERALNFMTLRRSEVKRSMWVVSVLLPGLVMGVGVYAGREWVGVIGWKGADDLSAWLMMVAVGHALILLVGSSALVQATKSKAGTQGLQMAAGMMPMVMMVGGRFLDQSHRAAMVAYLNHPAALLVALLAVPLCWWSWKVAPGLGWGAVRRGTVLDVKGGDSEWVAAASGSGRGLRGVKLLVGMELIALFGLIVGLPLASLFIAVGNYSRTGEFVWTHSIGFLWVMVPFVLLFTLLDIKTLRLLGLPAKKLAGLMLVTPVLFAVILTVGLALIGESPLEFGWGVGLFGCVLGGACCLRLLSLHLPPVGVILLMAILAGFLSFEGSKMEQLLTLESVLWVYGGACGVLLAVGCWWVLVQSLARGRNLYAVNKKLRSWMQR